MDVRAKTKRGETCVAVVLPGARDLLPIASTSTERYPCLLESVSGPRKTARYDILFAFPQETIELRPESAERFLDKLDDAWRIERSDERGELPFRGGWFLFLTYELAGEIEPSLPLRRDSELPVAMAVRCPAAIVVDRFAQTTTLIAENTHAHLLDQLRRDVDAPHSDDAFVVVSVEEDDSATFLDGVARIHAHLHDGDTFQVNLSREWRARCARNTTPAALYARLRESNPSPFAALLQWSEWAVISSSPERLVEVRNGIAQTRPIAGTRPRTSDDDAERIREFVANDKERAEHVMLIDLERNDLGRICEAGSVCVDELMTVESYAHVHHIVSNVSGKLRAGVTPGDVIRAVFPGGTITGCPKVRCMQIIAELEDAPRGVYTGAIGYLDRNGDMDLNILIRTLTLRDGRINFRAGAGIVADSVAERELDETRAKARGLLRALSAHS